MDALLDERWRTDKPPFDADCLIADESLTVDGLRELLVVTVSILRKRHAGLSLYSFDDWHQHDGFITQRRSADWTEIEDACSSRDSLISFRQGDYRVYRAFYAESLTFLLRVDVKDDPTGEGSSFYGAFDLCANSETLHEVLNSISPDLRRQLQTAAAKPYFVRTYSG